MNKKYEINKIYLKDYEVEMKDILDKEYSKRILSIYPCVFSIENVMESLRQYLNGNMYYNIKTGKTYFKKEVISEYSNKLDIPNINITDYSDIESILYGFKCIIFSSANRLHMGHKDV